MGRTNKPILYKDVSTIFRLNKKGQLERLYETKHKSNWKLLKRSKPSLMTKFGIYYIHRIIACLKSGRDLIDGDKVTFLDGNKKNYNVSNIHIESKTEEPTISDKDALVELLRENKISLPELYLEPDEGTLNKHRDYLRETYRQMVKAR